MKRLVLLVVVALGMSATSFAGEKVEGKDWKVDVNVAKLSKYLDRKSTRRERDNEQLIDLYQGLNATENAFIVS